MEQERKSKLRERKMTNDSTHPNPVVERLKTVLFDFGGEAVAMNGPSSNLELILQRGKLVSGEGADFRKGNPSDCHANSGDGFVRFGNQIATGYALSIDGIWREHSWNVDQASGTIIETTELRIAYFGYILDREEAERFAELNPVERPLKMGDDDPDLDLLLICRPGETEVTLTDDGALELRSRRLIDQSVLGQGVWIIEYDANPEAFRVLGQGFIEDYESDDEAEIQTILQSSEFSTVNPPVEVLEPAAADLLKRTDRTEVLIDITGNSPLVEYFRSLTPPAPADWFEELD